LDGEVDEGSLGSVEQLKPQPLTQGHPLEQDQSPFGERKQLTFPEKKS